MPPADNIDIRGFPTSDAVWQADLFRAPAWVANGRGGGYRPWMVLVLDKFKTHVLTISNVTGDPTPEMLLDYLVRTMAKPNDGPALRPRSIEVSNPKYHEYLRPRLDECGVECRLVDELAEFNECCVRWRTASTSRKSVRSPMGKA